ncbi:hormone-sensitive lipase-like, partial [Paramuricea clavata]
METYYIESDYEYLPGLFSSLTEVLVENRQYYSGINDCSKSREFSQCFEDLIEITGKTLKLLLEVAAVSPLFDYDPNTKGNGYRTIVRVVEMCFRRLHSLGEDFQKSRAGFLFRSDHYYKEIVSYLDLSKGLFKFLEFAKLLLEWSDGNDLFPPENCYDAKTMTECHLHEMEKECFYGRRLGFHFNTALRGFLTTVCISMASFGDGYAKHDGSFTVAAVSLLNGPKYLINPDLRAKRLISLSTLVDMEFCKAFWSLTERYGFQ